jgi:DDE superfamily endonuclease
VIDDSGDREDGRKTVHVGHQWLGRYGKTDNGVVTVTTVWADERLYYPVDAVPYTRAKHFAKGKSDPGFRTELAIGADLAIQARDAGFTFRAVAADSAHGDQDGFRGELAEAGLPFVMALKPRHGTWAYGPGAHTPADAARVLAWGGPEDPWHRTPVARTFRDGTPRHGGPLTRLWAGGDLTGLPAWWLPLPTRHLAGQGHLVPGHQLAPPGRPARGRQPAPGRGPGGDRADLRHPALDRAGLHAGQGRAKLD